MVDGEHVHFIVIVIVNVMCIFVYFATCYLWCLYGSEINLKNYKINTRSLRKVSATEREKEREITLLIVATTFAMQPVCHAAWAANALRSDKNNLNCCDIIVKPSIQ